MTLFNQLWDHLWQSTLVAMLVCCLIPLFRDNSARARYGLWLAASLKFLLPFSLLAAFGRMIFVHTAAPQSMAVLARMQPVAMPFSTVAPAAQHFPWAGVFLAIWLTGVAVVAAVWAVRWYRLSAATRAARPLAFDLPIPVQAADALREPGLAGIWRPVILLPEGIVERLSVAEVDAILRHELCHWRRRDNLLAVLHMLVACVFWFHPLVWFVGARLIEERERACDEEVLAGGGSPLEYARTILKVCDLYLRSPLPCAAGVSGADLDRRITAIMARNEVLEVDVSRKALLMALALATVLTPFITGGLKPAPVVAVARSLAQVLVPAVPAFTAPAPRAIVPARAARGANRHRLQKAAAKNSIDIRPPALVAPAINATAFMIIVPTPQIETEAPASEPEKNVCRPPQQLANSRLLGPEVCLPQHEWDRINEQGLLLMPDGRTLATNLEKETALTSRRCYSAGGGASSFPVNATACY